MSDELPPTQDILEMLQRMHTTAASSESSAGSHASSARQDQLAAKYRDAAKRAGGAR